MADWEAFSKCLRDIAEFLSEGTICLSEFVQLNKFNPLSNRLISLPRRLKRMLLAVFDFLLLFFALWTSYKLDGSINAVRARL